MKKRLPPERREPLFLCSVSTVYLAATSAQHPSSRDCSDSLPHGVTVECTPSIHNIDLQSDRKTFFFPPPRYPTDPTAADSHHLLPAQSARLVLRPAPGSSLHFSDDSAFADAVPATFVRPQSAASCSISAYAASYSLGIRPSRIASLMAALISPI